MAYYALFTFIDPENDSDPDSNPIPVAGSYDGNLNPTPCSVKCST